MRICCMLRATVSATAIGFRSMTKQVESGMEVSINIGNSNDLKGLFRKWMKSGKKSSTSYSYPSYNQRYGYEGYGSSSSATILFYEWSDLKRMPRKFHTLKSFETFMTDCGIVLKPFERDILTNLGFCYVVCKNGCKDLIIRGSYDLLEKAFNGYEMLKGNPSYKNT